MRKRHSHFIHRAQFAEIGRGIENKFAAAVGIFQLLQIQLEVGFFLGAFAFGNLFAETARMFAIERARHRLLQGNRMKIIRQHRRPRDGLKHQPMCAGRRQHGDNHQHMAKSSEHEAKYQRAAAFRQSLSNPHQSAARQFLEERNQIGVGEMNATARRRFTNRGLVTGAVDVNVARVGIDVPAPIDARFQPVQPQDTRGDFSIGHAFPGIANRLACFENCPGRPAAADFFFDTMQAKRRAVGVFDLPDTET